MAAATPGFLITFLERVGPGLRGVTAPIRPRSKAPNKRGVFVRRAVSLPFQERLCRLIKCKSRLDRKPFRQEKKSTSRIKRFLFTSVQNTFQPRSFESKAPAHRPCTAFATISRHQQAPYLYNEHLQVEKLHPKPSRIPKKSYSAEGTAPGGDLDGG